ncbi:MAG: right-handed parallel beta-helix repeat-containing protein [Woeseiaceae bacterium]|nr:right-handed parallel beta-helix repeat-containing protein [Woeseiaceae bacterium]
MRRDIATWVPLLLLAVLGALAGIGNILQSEFGSRSADGVADQLVVTSRSDRGPGSLRTALFTAMKAPQPVTIRLDVDVVDVYVPLPPIAVDGLKIVGDAANRTVLRRHAGDDGDDVPLLRIIADDVSLRGFDVDGGAGTALRVTGSGFSAVELGIVNSGVGIDSVDVDEVEFRHCRFASNDIALRLSGRGTRATIADSDFHENIDAAVWIVFTGDSGSVRLFDNTIRGGRDGVVAVNSEIDIRGNFVGNFSRSGLSLSDAVATVSDNRLMNSRGIGISAARLTNSVIIGNEISRNDQIGVLIVDANGLRVDRNEIYNNGYGIAAVGLKPISASLKNNTLVGQSIDGLVAIGESPVIDGNRALRNRQAGIRILDLVLPDQPVIEALPQLANNVMTDNGDDDVVYGKYVVRNP